MSSSDRRGALRYDDADGTAGKAIVAGRFLAIAAIAVIALLGGLWFLMNDGDESVAIDAPRDSAPEKVATSDKAPVVEPTVKRTPLPPVVLKRPTHQPEAPSNAPTNAPTLTDDAAVKPATIEDALKEQVLLTESQVLECSDKALKAGKKLEGEAAVGFTVARKDGKIIIESTGIEYATIDWDVANCIRESARAMVFDSLPDGVDALTGYRKVVFSNGALKRQWMTTYGVTRPPPPPPPAP